IFAADEAVQGLPQVVDAAVINGAHVIQGCGGIIKAGGCDEMWGQQRATPEVRRHGRAGAACHGYCKGWAPLTFDATPRMSALGQQYSSSHYILSPIVEFWMRLQYA